MLRSLTDPNISALRSAPREERDCWIAASNSGMLAFDNLSSIPGWLSDALCRIATGGGYATRQLHTDDDEILFDAVRPTLITSVSDVIARSDLADRAILIELPPIPEDRRQPEEEFNARLEAARPRILGALLDAMVVGMRNRDAVSLTKLPRLADFATWATACEPSFTPEGGVMTAYAENHRETVKVSLSPAERAAIEERAVATGRSLSSLLRDLGLGFEPKAILDLQAVQALVKVNADQGRLGGLLKLWLTDRPGEGAPTIEVRRLLQEIESAQAELRRLIQRL